MQLSIVSGYTYSNYMYMQNIFHQLMFSGATIIIYNEL